MCHTGHNSPQVDLKRAVDVVCIARITLPLFPLYPAVLCTMWKSVQKADGPLLSSNLICNLLKQSQWNPADNQKRAFILVHVWWLMRMASLIASMSYCLFGAQWVDLHWCPRLAPSPYSRGLIHTDRAPFIAFLYCIFAAQCKAQ